MKDDQKCIREATAYMREALRHLRAANICAIDALNLLEVDEISSLDTIKHYKNQIKETHRILAAEWTRRWGSLPGCDVVNARENVAPAPSV